MVIWCFDFFVFLVGYSAGYNKGYNNTEDAYREKVYRLIKTTEELNEILSKVKHKPIIFKTKEELSDYIGDMIKIYNDSLKDVKET